MTSWQLDGLGRMPWARARAVLDGCTCAWMDLDGLHIQTPPTHAPIATHLWGWADNHYVRARLDDDEAYLAILRPPNKNNTAGEDVTVHARPAILRNAAETDTQHTIARSDSLAVELLEIPGPHPITFVRATQPT